MRVFHNDEALENVGIKKKGSHIFIQVLRWCDNIQFYSLKN